MSVVDFSLVLPAFNEGATLERTIREITHELAASCISYELIVVNNGSTDKTRDVLEKLRAGDDHIVPVHLPTNQGYGGGILMGLQKSSGRILGWADADGQQMASDIVRLYSALVESDAGFVKAIRMIRHDHALRLVQSYLYNTIFLCLFGGGVSDVNAKPKLFTRSTFQTINPKSKDWFIDAEVVIRALRTHTRIIELPVHWTSRRGGKSNVRIATVVEFMRNMLQFMLSSHI